MSSSIRDALSSKKRKVTSVDAPIVVQTSNQDGITMMGSGHGPMIQVSAQRPILRMTKAELFAAIEASPVLMKIYGIQDSLVVMQGTFRYSNVDMIVSACLHVTHPVFSLDHVAMNCYSNQLDRSLLNFRSAP